MIISRTRKNICARKVQNDTILDLVCRNHRLRVDDDYSLARANCDVVGYSTASREARAKKAQTDNRQMMMIILAVLVLWLVLALVVATVGRGKKR